MRVVLLAAAASFAALAVPASAAAALDSAGSQFTSGAAASVSVHRGHPDRDRRGRRHRGFDGSVFFGDREYQGDTAWRSNSYNDWWHDRPDRAYPRWMQHNQNCERRWQSGDGEWRC
jgi:hypothetical protein